MKNIFAVLLILLLATNAGAQGLTPSDLLNKLNCISFECFNGYFTAANYTLADTQNDPTTGNTTYSYSANVRATIPGTTIQAANGVSVDMRNGTVADIIFTTPFTNDYNTLLNAFTAMGYAKGDPIYRDGETAYYYYSAANPTRMFMLRTPQMNKDGYNFTMYSFAFFINQ